MTNAVQFLAIKLKGVTCRWNGIGNSNDQKLLSNDLFNGGCMKFESGTGCFNEFKYSKNLGKLPGVLEGHCRESQATMVFMFMTAVLLLASGLMGFLKRRKGY